MKPELYLQRLRDLRNFLKENPQQKPVYSDVNIDYEILKTKQRIWESEEKENAQYRQYDSDFVPADRIPFQ